MRRRTGDHARRLLMALLSLLLLVQLSGIAHVAYDLFADADEVAAHVVADDDDGDCPPGCPTCHHANGGVGAPPVSSAVLAIAPLVALETSAPLYDEALPPRPELPSIFRPPRS